MGVVQLVRQGVLGVTTLFSIVELAITAHLISQTQQYFNYTATFCALGVAVAAVSLVTLPIMLVVDFIRRGAFTSMIVVELAWLLILCILWVATAGQTVSDYDRFFPFGCNFENLIYNGLCQQTQAIEAFAFLNFIIVLLYAILLSVMAAIAATRGQDVWLSSVKESFGSSAGTVQYPMTQHNTSAPPKPQVVHQTGIPVQAQYTPGYTHHGTTPGGPAVAV